MIYTVTFNPAIDYVVWLDGLRPGAVNRARRELIQFGGKGINVSVMLGRLGVEKVAVGDADRDAACVLNDTVQRNIVLREEI